MFSFAQDREIEEIANFLKAGPRTWAEIRRYLHECCCSDSRAATTGLQLAALAADGLVECRNGFYHLKEYEMQLATGRSHADTGVMVDCFVGPW